MNDTPLWLGRGDHRTLLTEGLRARNIVGPLSFHSVNHRITLHSFVLRSAIRAHALCCSLLLVFPDSLFTPFHSDVAPRCCVYSLCSYAAYRALTSVRIVCTTLWNLRAHTQVVVCHVSRDKSRPRKRTCWVLASPPSLRSGLPTSCSPRPLRSLW